MSGSVFRRIRVNGTSLADERFAPYIDKNGIFNWKGVTIKPSGSVRVGDTKIHPSGLIQVGDQVHVEGSVVGSKTLRTMNNQSTSRNVLRESSTKTNVQTKNVTFSEKDTGLAAKKNGGESLGQAAGSKRKSTDTAPESAKKQKTGTYEEPTISAETRNASATAPRAPQNVYDIELDGQWSDNVLVYESCDQIRRKIDLYLAQPGVTKAQFCRDLTNQLYSPSAPKNIQSKMLEDFRKKHGASGGCTSSVFYAAYVFFERLRIMRNEAKSKHRLEMEKAWPRGMDRDRDVTNRGIFCGPGGRPHQDSYGRWSVRY